MRRTAGRSRGGASLGDDQGRAEQRDLRLRAEQRAGTIGPIRSARGATLTAFVGFGGLIAALTGDLTSSGFQLQGVPALIAIALVVAYFVLGRRLGGPVWRRLLRAR